MATEAVSYARSANADLKKKVLLTPADHFRIGSNTKTFVIGVLPQLVAEGKLGLDGPLSRFSLGVKRTQRQEYHRPRAVRYAESVRGVRYAAVRAVGYEGPTRVDPRMLVAWAVRQKPYFAPGTSYRYSNTNYLLLGLIIENITKDNVGDQIRRRLLEPFGLTQTKYTPNRGHAESLGARL
jgi:D-alanyl-D-alanine carboxypeptidase